MAGVMFVGDITKVDIGTSSFEKLITEKSLYIDKSRFIEHFLNETPSAQLITRQRRIGKSLNMDMLRCFLTDSADHRDLFENLYIKSSPVWEKANSAPVFLFSFKNLNLETYRDVISDMINEYANEYLPACTGALQTSYRNWFAERGLRSDGLLLLTKIVCAATGKKSYIFVDEYDKLLLDIARAARYSEVRDYFTQFYSAGLKDNPYLKKGLLTGVMRLSHEGMFSGLNNIKTYDVFKDAVYNDDYGITENEMSELARVAGFDLAEARRWYNGIKVQGIPIYNTFGVMSMIDGGNEFDCYWNRSGTMDIIVSLLNPQRKRTLLSLLEFGSTAQVSVESRVSPQTLFSEKTDDMFYSLLIQSGYLSLEKQSGTKAAVAVPNVELQEVWSRFLLRQLVPDQSALDGLFTNIADPALLARDIAGFLTPLLEGLSYFDLPEPPGADGRKRTPEVYYHIFLYGVLRMGIDNLGCTRLLSNRESGGGRYDVMAERENEAVVFELKTAAEGENLDALAQAALRQIIGSRYGADTGKPVVAVGLAFRGKNCRAAARRL
ncbi:MAG: ATP-binding protein [Clostridiales bacterium]|nr:ATP-binding protein [Clostridiales bacterium]